VEGPITALGFVAPGARVEGDVTLHQDSGVWYGAVVRGVDAPVVIEARANVQDNCVVEGTPGHPARVGAGATLGHNARVYGASVDANAMIAIGATVMPGARVGTHSIVAANAVVPEGMRVPPRTLVIGNGRLLREVTQAEIERIEHGGEEYVRLAHEHAQTLSATRTG
jgi:carbonic anhydrase/acetyltransferase-like protein (isoleucine patch superfamily)